jgi:septal ring factor EnvC (AmiA/AmiB activator)
MTTALFAAATPALGRQLMTKQETKVYETPDRNSDTTGKLPGNFRVQSDKRQDFWFHVTAKVDGKTFSGWVNQVDVVSRMGRSKGQLIEQVDRLYDELVALRKQKADLEKRVEEASEELEATSKRLKESQRELNRAQQQIEQLQAAVQRRPGGRR